MKDQKIKEDFEEWFYDLYGPFSLRSEWFYGDCGTKNKEIMVEWLYAAFEEGYRRAQ